MAVSKGPWPALQHAAVTGAYGPSDLPKAAQAALAEIPDEALIALILRAHDAAFQAGLDAMAAVAISELQACEAWHQLWATLAYDAGQVLLARRRGNGH